MTFEKLLSEFGEREMDKLYGRESISVSQDAYRAGAQSLAPLLLRAVEALKYNAHVNIDTRDRVNGSEIAKNALAEITRALEEGKNG